MTSAHNSSGASTDEAPLLEKALEKNREVEDTVENCAAELSTINDTTKKTMMAGLTLLPAEKVLAISESVKDKVQECAGELHEVNEVLAREVDERNKLNHELIETLQELSGTKNGLHDTQDVLAVAHEVVEQTKRRILRDFVTGIPSRELFNDRLEQAISLARRCGWLLAVMFIDLDRFKQINDTHGHALGDKVLQTVAQRLLLEIRGEDTICRYGGDEFLCLLINPKGIENIHHIARKVSDRISRAVILDGLTLSIESSIGIAVYPGNGCTGDELVANADAAMYRAKKAKAGIVFFDDVKDQAGRDARSGS